MYIYIYIYIYILYMYIYIYIIYMYIYTYMYIYMYIYNICIYVYACICIYIYICLCVTVCFIFSSRPTLQNRTKMSIYSVEIDPALMLWILRHNNHNNITSICCLKIAEAVLHHPRHLYANIFLLSPRSLESSSMSFQLICLPSPPFPLICMSSVHQPGLAKHISNQIANRTRHRHDNQNIG